MLHHGWFINQLRSKQRSVSCLSILVQAPSQARFRISPLGRQLTCSYRGAHLIPCRDVRPPCMLHSRWFINQL